MASSARDSTPIDSRLTSTSSSHTPMKPITVARLTSASCRAPQ